MSIVLRSALPLVTSAQRLVWCVRTQEVAESDGSEFMLKYSPTGV